MKSCSSFTEKNTSMTDMAISDCDWADSQNSDKPKKNEEKLIMEITQK